MVPIKIFTPVIGEDGRVLVSADDREFLVQNIPTDVFEEWSRGPIAKRIKWVRLSDVEAAAFNPWWNALTARYEDILTGVPCDGPPLV